MLEERIIAADAERICVRPQIVSFARKFLLPALGIVLSRAQEISTRITIDNTIARITCSMFANGLYDCIVALAV